MPSSEDLWQAAPLAASAHDRSTLSPVPPFSPAPSLSFSPSHSAQSSVSSAASSALITPAPWIPRAHNSDRTQKTSSVCSDRSYRPLPTLPRSNSMSSLRGPVLPRPNVRAPFTPALTIPTIPHELAGADSPSSSSIYLPSPALASPESAVSHRSSRSVRRLPQTPDELLPQPHASAERPQMLRNATTTALRAPRRPLPPSLSRAYTDVPLLTDKYDAPTPRRPAHDVTPVPTRRASPPALKLVTALEPPAPHSPPLAFRKRSNSSPATPVSGTSTPLSPEEEKSAEDVRRANLVKLQRMLSANVPPELVLHLREDDEESVSSSGCGASTLEGVLEGEDEDEGADEDEDEDEGVPMSAIEFSAPSPVASARPALVARHARRIRPVWDAEARLSGLSGHARAEEKEGAPLLRADAFDRESRRMSRKWVREVRGRRWVEEDIQDVVMQLRLLRR